jgi:predicted short-subunit dehydrogenase-like oxidoreductase (DUF2520 family)
MSNATVGVVGAGRVGAVLAAKFRAAGHPIVGVSGRSASTRLRVQTLLPGVHTVSPIELAQRADILILAVPDDALVEVASSLAAHARPGQVVLHTSGRHGLDVLPWWPRPWMSCVNPESPTRPLCCGRC